MPECEESKTHSSDLIRANRSTQIESNRDYVVVVTELRGTQTLHITIQSRALNVRYTV